MSRSLFRSLVRQPGSRSTRDRDVFFWDCYAWHSDPLSISLQLVDERDAFLPHEAAQELAAQRTRPWIARYLPSLPIHCT